MKVAELDLHNELSKPASDEKRNTGLVYSVRVCAGTWLLVWDSAVSLAQHPQRILQRGAQVEEQFAAAATSMRKQPAIMAERVGGWFASRWRSVTDAPLAVNDTALQAQVATLLEKLGVPNRERLLRLGHEIDVLSARIDSELARSAPDEVIATL